MARWSANIPTMTSSAIGDGANLTTQTFLALLGGSTTQRINLLEVYIGGQAAASAPNYFVLARDSTVSAGVTSNGVRTIALDPATAALAAAPIGTNVGSGTLPQRSASSLLNLSVNLFGGLVRWVAAPGEEIGMLGNTASNGEISLSGYTGSTAGLYGAHFIFEPF